MPAALTENHVRSLVASSNYLFASYKDTDGTWHYPGGPVALPLPGPESLWAAHDQAAKPLPVQQPRELNS